MARPPTGLMASPTPAVGQGHGQGQGQGCRGLVGRDLASTSLPDEPGWDHHA